MVPVNALACRRALQGFLTQMVVHDAPRVLVGEADEACRLHGGTLAQKFLNDVEGDIVVQKLPPARMTDDLGPDQGLVQSADSGEGVELLAHIALVEVGDDTPETEHVRSVHDIADLLHGPVRNLDFPFPDTRDPDGAGRVVKIFEVIQGQGFAEPEGAVADKQKDEVQALPAAFLRIGAGGVCPFLPGGSQFLQLFARQLLHGKSSCLCKNSARPGSAFSRRGTGVFPFIPFFASGVYVRPGAAVPGRTVFISKEDL